MSVLLAIQSRVKLTDRYEFMPIYIKDFIKDIKGYTTHKTLQTILALYKVGFITALPFNGSTAIRDVVIYDVTYKGQEFYECARYSYNNNGATQIDVSQIDRWVKEVTKKIVDESAHGIGGNLTD